MTKIKILNLKQYLNKKNNILIESILLEGINKIFVRDILTDMSDVIIKAYSKYPELIAEEEKEEITKKVINKKVFEKHFEELSKKIREEFNEEHKVNKNFHIEFMTLLYTIAKLEKKGISFKEIIRTKEYKNFKGWKAPFYKVMDIIPNKIKKDIIKESQRFIKTAYKSLERKYSKMGKIGIKMNNIVKSLIKETKKPVRDINLELFNTAGAAYNLSLITSSSPVEENDVMAEIMSNIGLVSSNTRTEVQTSLLAEILYKAKYKLKELKILDVKDTKGNTNKAGYIKWIDKKNKEQDLVVLGLDDYTAEDKGKHMELMLNRIAEDEKIVTISDSRVDHIVWDEAFFKKFYGREDRRIRIMIGGKKTEKDKLDGIHARFPTLSEALKYSKLFVHGI